MLSPRTPHDDRDMGAAVAAYSTPLIRTPARHASTLVCPLLPVLCLCSCCARLQNQSRRFCCCRCRHRRRHGWMTILSTGAAGVDVAFDVDWLAPLLASEMYACCARLQKPESEHRSIHLRKWFMPQSPSTSRTARDPSARTQSSLHDSSPPCTTCTWHIARRSHNLCRDVRSYCSCSCSFSNSSRGRTSIGFASPASVAADWPPVSATARKEGPAPMHECLSWLNLVGLAHEREPGARWC